MNPLDQIDIELNTTRGDVDALASTRATMIDVANRLTNPDTHGYKDFKNYFAANRLGDPDPRGNQIFRDYFAATIITTLMQNNPDLAGELTQVLQLLEGGVTEEVRNTLVQRLREDDSLRLQINTVLKRLEEQRVEYNMEKHQLQNEFIAGTESTRNLTRLRATTRILVLLLVTLLISGGYFAFTSKLQNDEIATLQTQLANARHEISTMPEYLMSQGWVPAITDLVAAPQETTVGGNNFPASTFTPNPDN